MARHYRFLSFQAGIDWKDVNPKILNRLNRLGMKLHKTITITSGFRSYAKQKYLYDHAEELGLVRGKTVAAPGHSMHNKGLAVDAEINGKAINKVVSNKTLSSFGLVAPVKGDPVHVQLLGGSAGKAAPAVSPSPSQTTDTAASPVAGSVPQYLPPGSPPQPEETHPSVYAPGAAGVGGFTPQSAPSTWRELAAMPLSSPETQLYAQRAGGQ